VAAIHLSGEYVRLLLDDFTCAQVPSRTRERLVNILEVPCNDNHGQNEHIQDYD